MNTINELWERNNESTRDLAAEVKIREENKVKVKTANQIDCYPSLFQNYTTLSEPLSLLIVSDKDQFYYKNWQILIYEFKVEQIPTIDTNPMLDMLSANLRYNVIMKETKESKIGFYNTGDEMRQVGFFSVEKQFLFFNVSVFFKKIFGSMETRYTEVITNPSAHLEIIIKPFQRVEQ